MWQVPELSQLSHAAGGTNELYVYSDSALKGGDFFFKPCQTNPIASYDNSWGATSEWRVKLAGAIDAWGSIWKLDNYPGTWSVLVSAIILVLLS